jgi:hypothetical protein
LYFSITIDDLNYVTDNTRDDMSLFSDDLDSSFDKSEEERATDDSDAYVCESLDEPNYISATMPIIPICQDGSWI